MTKVLVVEQEGLLMSEGRRAPSNVDEHIVYRPVGAPNQLRLASPKAAVHPAYHPFCRARLGVLHEPRRETGTAEVVVEDVRIEGAGEQAAVVAKRLWDQNQHVGKVCRLDAHQEMLS